MPLGSGWLTPKRTDEDAKHILKAGLEPQYLEDALQAAQEIMNDDINAAEAGLRNGNSAFHKLGRGVVIFMKATMGFEQEVMKKAADRLAEAETHALNDHRQVQNSPHSFQSSIYPTGTEFALCGAEAQLMSAVVGVLNESVTESIKGFYKLRKAYLTLDSILASEVKYLKDNGGTGSARNSVESDRLSKGTPSAQDSRPATPSKIQTQVSSPLAVKVENASDISPSGEGDGEDTDDDDEFVDAVETLEHHITPMHSFGHIDTQITQRALANLTIAAEKEPEQERTDSPQPGVNPTRDRVIHHGPDSDIFSNPIDLFVHSGSNLCFGLLLLMISMIPPAFGKLLYIIGFKGDRERGLRMLWQASKFHNINGAMAGLVLLGYYNGIVGFCDILPDTGEDVVDGYPTEKCEALLADMRERHPRSHLWMVEEARMEASSRRVENAVTLLSRDMTTQLKQVEAIAMFEKGLNSLYSHQYALCSESFMKPQEAKKNAAKAEDLLKQVPGMTGKKRFMAKQLPFDIFVSRKVQKWTQRAADKQVSFVDAIGVSPGMEMVYFWNGFKRMNESQLRYCLERLEWSKTSENVYGWEDEALDEKAILALVEAVVHRNLHNGEKLERILKNEIMAHDKSLFKGHLKDDWVAPSAHYEMAVLCWEQKDQGRVPECREWLDKAARWEAYDLDARIGLKITTALDTLRRYEGNT
ncbi:MAG: Tetratricopeptide repeat protein 39C [Vezdaea aestivalis]|nr:MAG: Tetratricopeptide repeat protein 39C [Vezdaea aestivalis]